MRARKTKKQRQREAAWRRALREGAFFTLPPDAEVALYLIVLEHVHMLDEWAANDISRLARIAPGTARRHLNAQVAEPRFSTVSRVLRAVGFPLGMAPSAPRKAREAMGERYTPAYVREMAESVRV